MNRHLIALALTFAGLVSCQPKDKVPGETANTTLSERDIPAQMNVVYQVVSNLNNDCQFEGDCFDANLTLSLPFESTSKDWTIYFSNTKPIKYESSDQFDIVHLNGDLHKLTPTPDFNGFKANTPYTIHFQALGATVTKNDVMPNFIFENAGHLPEIIASTKEQFDPQSGLYTLPHAGYFNNPEQWRRAKNDNVPLATPEWLFEKYRRENSRRVVTGNRIIPKMAQTQWQNHRLSVANGVLLPVETSQAARASLEASGLSFNPEGMPVSWVLQDMPEEHYLLDIGQTGIKITAGDNAGIFYALQSLSQLYDPESKTLPLGRASDYPRYPFRGVHVDVARNFQDKTFLLRLIKQMGHLKFNKLHLHLAEDEAWRLEIPGLPELTQIGSRRCLDLQDKQCLSPQLGAGIDPKSQVNGYLSLQDYKDVLIAAQQNHIEVIPSLDMPGHSRAAIQAMEARYNKYIALERPDLASEFMLIDLEDTTEYSSIQHYNDNTINPCIDSSYRFVDKVLTEINNMHQQAGVPLQRYHIGADETAGAWVESPQCQALMQRENIKKPAQLTAYFIARVTKMVNGMDVMAAAWSDGLSHVEPMRLGSQIQANLWETLPSGGQHMAHKMTNQGWETVLSLPDILYFDFPYMPHPNETGYYWGSRYTSTFQVFQFMPDNLPVHAEFWLDSMGNPYSSDDETPLNGERKVKGIQAQLWSETLRHETQAEYMLFPRLVAVAERAWHKPDWEVPYVSGTRYSQQTGYFNDDLRDRQLTDWQGFVGAMTRNILPKLERDNVFYRLPPAGARIENGTLHTNVPWPNLSVEFSVDGGKHWEAYSKPVNVETATKVLLRTYTPLSDRRSQAFPVHVNHP